MEGIVPVFFDRGVDSAIARRAVRRALERHPEAERTLGAQADSIVESVAIESGAVAQPRWWSFAVAGVLLAVFAAMAVWAEGQQMATATEQLWTAFQTVLGVVVGFIAGEAAGLGTSKSGT
jgi:hypothetical protein